MTRYQSARGGEAGLGFLDVAWRGLAADGGLFAPEAWPRFADDARAALAGRPYAEVAGATLALFAGDDWDAADLTRLAREAYADFAHAAVTPLVQIGPDEWLLELFHGPTLAFKDLAMRALAPIMRRAGVAQGGKAAVMAATSGDTGAAAAAAFATPEWAPELFILYPHGRVSEVQRKQMTATGAANVHALAVEGDFDACQRLVKQAFGDAQLAAQGWAITGVNSINFVRVAAQAAYYLAATAALGRVRFVVPTGNFGDAFAGWIAAALGAPVERIALAVNANATLVRALDEGVYQPGTTLPTLAPSMDIQAPSNFERLLFEACGRDGARTRAMTATLAEEGALRLPQDVRAYIGARFLAASVDEEAMFAAMRAVWRETGTAVDPHTAVGVAAGRALGKPPCGAPRVYLATAHPAKFPEAMTRGLGFAPPAPARLAPAGAERARVVAPTMEALREAMNEAMNEAQ